MRLAFISSVRFLDLCALGDIDLCLAPMVRDYEIYREHFKRASEQGRFVILDNGAAEGELLDNKDLFELARYIKATEVVAPDVFYDGPATVRAVEVFLKEKQENHMRIEVMAVPQGKTREEYLECAERLTMMPGVARLGISKYAASVSFTGDKHTPLIVSRSMAVDGILDSCGPTRIHLLGGDYTLPWEIQRYARHPYVHSNDSAFVYRLGQGHIKLEPGQLAPQDGSAHSADLFAPPPTRAQRFASYHNAQTLLETAGGKPQ